MDRDSVRGDGDTGSDDDRVGRDLEEEEPQAVASGAQDAEDIAESLDRSTPKLSTPQRFENDGDELVDGMEMIQEEEDQDGHDDSDDDEEGEPRSPLPLPLPQQQQRESQEDEDDIAGNSLPKWIRANFPHVKSECELQQPESQDHSQYQQQQQQQPSIYSDEGGFENESCCSLSREQLQLSSKPFLLRCEECCARLATFACSECEQRLCFRCTDAIHIIPSLASHTIQEFVENPQSPSVYDITQDSSKPFSNQSHLQPRTEELPPAAPIVSPRVNHQHQHPLPGLSHWDPTTQVESRLALPIGTRVFFRTQENCGRWSRELLHSTVIHDDGVRANAQSTFYYRLVWLRGVEVLPNGFFRASLELSITTTSHTTESSDLHSSSHTSTSSPLTGSQWPQEIGIFPTQLGAFRAVITAEAVARMMFRREQVSGRFVASEFPSVLVLNEILEEVDAILGEEFKIRLSKQDDLQFLRDIGRGVWGCRAWMKTIGREEQLKEEDATTLSASSHTSQVSHQSHAKRHISSTSSSMTATPMPWQPSGRIRFFLVEQSELLFPEQEQKKHLESVMTQMLNVYIGFAWKRWRKFIKRHRRQELHERRHHGAKRIQNWLRRLTQQWQEVEANRRASLDAPFLALQLYQRRQLCGRRHGDVQAVPCQPRRTNGHVVLDHPRSRARRRVPFWKELPRRKTHCRRADYTTSVLLQEISVFICLAQDAELEAFEKEHVASTLPASEDKQKQLSRVNSKVKAATPTRASFSMRQKSQSKNHQPEGVHRSKQEDNNGSTEAGQSLQTPWMFERVVRSKYEALQVELRAAVKMNLRQVQLAQSELDDSRLPPPAVATTGIPMTAATAPLPAELDPVRIETLANKVILAQQNAEKSSRKALDSLTMELEFMHFPIQKDGVPETEQLDAFLLASEDLLRAKRNIYVFSMNGHGRTGFIGALLLGRLYGIPSLEALERAQRLHDCQWSMHSVASNRSTSSPKAAVQITAVQRLLAHWDTIYAPITNENSAEDFHAWRAQQRGLVVEPFLSKDGFMISDKPDASTASGQLAEYKRLQRIWRESLVIMELAMVGAATRVVDDLVRAVEQLQVVECPHQEDNVEKPVEEVMETLAARVIENQS